MGSSDSDDDFQKSEVDPPQSCSVYLLKYSKANAEKFPSRQRFSSADWCWGKSFGHVVRNTTKTRTFTTIWRSVWPNCDPWNQWKCDLNQSTISTCISLINLLVTLELTGTFPNLKRKYCIVKTNLTLEILAPPESKPLWKPTRQKTVPHTSLVNLSVHFHQKEQKYLFQNSRPSALNLQMLQSTFLRTGSGHTLVCKLKL